VTGSDAEEKDDESDDEGDDEGDDESDSNGVEMKFVEEFWSPLPKGGRWTKQTYTQRVYAYILLLTDDEEGTDHRHLVAEDLLPAGRTKKKMLADQNECYVDVVAEWRKSHPSTPKRPTRPDDAPIGRRTRANS
jgi:hypothetical protein